MYLINAQYYYFRSYDFRNNIQMDLVWIKLIQIDIIVNGMLYTRTRFISTILNREAILIKPILILNYSMLLALISCMRALNA